MAAAVPGAGAGATSGDGSAGTVVGGEVWSEGTLIGLGIVGALGGLALMMMLGLVVETLIYVGGIRGLRDDPSPQEYKWNGHAIR